MARPGSTVLTLLLLATLLTPSASAQGLALDLGSEVATGLVRPTVIVAAGDGSGRLFIAEQTGKLLIWDQGLLATPFLDLSSVVTCCGERGLLGVAFHPNYATNGTFFVDYTRTVDSQLQTVVVRYQVSDADPDIADAASEEVLLTVAQPYTNHNGGQLAFGPDGYLYVALGDGGSGGDPDENGQDPDTLLGSILRLDVDDADPPVPYAIPADNPFVGVMAAKDEIWAYGLRNPWRFSFDRATGDLLIGDVGQGAWEEVDFQPAASSGGDNYGWDCREGAHDYTDTNGDDNTTCTGTGYTEPVLEYAHGSGRCSVTGGFRYRGTAEPRLWGVYLYADYCTGEIWGTVPRCDAGWESRVLLDPTFRVTAFGEDEAGELLVTEFDQTGTADSKVHRLVLAPGSDGPEVSPSPSSHDFGTLEAGVPAVVEITLSNPNPGPEAAVVVATTLSDPASFSLDPTGGSDPCLTTTPCLAPGANCTLEVRLLAGAPGSLAESLDLEGNFEPVAVPLTAEVTACSAPADLHLTSTTVSTAETYRACDTLTAGSGFTVTGAGDVTLRAGTAVILEDGFTVQSGGRLTVETF